MINIPVEDMSAIIIKARRHDAHPDFFNERNASITTLRDRLVDGALAPEMVVLKSGSYMRSHTWRRLEFPAAGGPFGQPLAGLSDPP